MDFVARSRKVNFMETETDQFERMKGFTAMSTSKNPIEYTRQYVDESFETTDIVGISTSIDYEFDQRASDPVHEKLVGIIDDEKIGDEAIITILAVDFTAEEGAGDTFKASKRDFAVIADTEGDQMEAYTYSGTFRVKGDRVLGTATSTDDWKTCTFTEE